MTTLSLFYITIPNENIGKKIAETLLSKKLIACANILPSHQSIYSWKEELCYEKENILILKTSTQLQDQVQEEVKKLHPYECPCILTFAPTHGNKEFIDWVTKQVL